MDFNGVSALVQVKISHAYLVYALSFPPAELEALETELESGTCVEAASLGSEDDGAFAFSEN